MKYVISIVVAVALGLGGQALAQDIIDSPVDHIFTPEGFDDNDNAQFVLNGYLRWSCDVPAKPEVKVDHDKGMIMVTQKVKRGNVMCLPLKHEFTSVVDLGALPYGEYDVVSVPNANLSDRLNIAEATNAGPDDYQYAQIDEVRVENIPEGPGARWSVQLKGWFVNSCQRWRFIKAIDSGNTVELLPVLTKAQSEDKCLPVMERFVARKDLPIMDEAGRKLLHVRSARGKAVNKVFNYQLAH